MVGDGTEIKAAIHHLGDHLFQLFAVVPAGAHHDLAMELDARLLEPGQPLHDVAGMAGLDLPQYLGKVKDANPEPAQESAAAE